MKEQKKVVANSVKTLEAQQEAELAIKEVTEVLAKHNADLLVEMVYGKHSISGKIVCVIHKND